jgi:hypothetical protein
MISSLLHVIGQLPPARHQRPKSQKGHHPGADDGLFLKLNGKFCQRSIIRS